jgi:hypothetical protein
LLASFMTLFMILQYLTQNAFVCVDQYCSCYASLHCITKWLSVVENLWNLGFSVVRFVMLVSRESDRIH